MVLSGHYIPRQLRVVVVQLAEPSWFKRRSTHTLEGLGGSVGGVGVSVGVSLGGGRGTLSTLPPLVNSTKRKVYIRHKKNEDPNDGKACKE